MWTMVLNGTGQQQEWLPRTALASVAAVDAAIEVAMRLYREAGSSATYRYRAIFDRCLRDLPTLGASYVSPFPGSLVVAGVREIHVLYVASLMCLNFITHALSFDSHS